VGVLHPAVEQDTPGSRRRVGVTGRADGTATLRKRGDVDSSAGIDGGHRLAGTARATIR
jgi:hypothetical protein